jgi:hypothetical protein
MVLSGGPLTKIRTVVVVEAVVTVVIFRGSEDSHVSAMLNVDPTETEEDVERAQVKANTMLAASDLLDSYVHERGLCAACNREKGTVQ